MGDFTFIVKFKGGEWSGKQHGGDLEACAPSSFELQRKLVQAALSSDHSSGAVQSSYSPVTPDSAVFQVIIGAAAPSNGGAAAPSNGGVAAPSNGGAAAPQAKTPAAEEKKKKKEEEESDDEYLSL